MDIRNFFGKKKSEGSTQPSKKKKPKEEHEEENTANNARRTKKAKLVILDSDDDDDHKKQEISTAAEVTRSSSKKKDVTKVSSNNRKDITAEAFFGNKNEKKNKKNDKDDDDVVTSSPAKKQRITEIKSSSSSPVRSSPRLQKKSDPSQRTSPEAPVTKSTKPISTTKSSSSKRKSVSSSSKANLLQPTLEVEEFDADSASPRCLDGKTFVISGVLPDISREDATELIKTLGGRVTTAVSSKTDYLITGTELEDGRPIHEGSKYKRAMQEGTILVDGTKKMYGLLQQYSNNATTKNMTQKSNGTKDSPISSKKSSPPPKAAPVASNNSSTAAVNPYARKVASNPYAKATKNPYAKKTSSPDVKKSIADTDNDRKPPATKSKDSNNTNPLWVDKYKPSSSKEILGNQDAVRKLTIWLNSWEQKFNNSKAMGKAFSSPNGPWKAALLSGPPGIGKTTTATLVAREAGRDLLEFNASDVRSKKAMQESLGDITGSRTLSFSKSSSNHKSNTKRCIIMDEVDGMGAGDRSGMAELIQMIKHSRVPIICVCNDRQNQKMKSLLPYCLDLRYRRPVKSVIAQRAIQVARQEGLSVEPNAAEAIIESCGNDVRQVINCLQMWASNSATDNTMTYKSLKERERSINKDEILRVSLFDAARVILEGRKGLNNADPAAERAHLMRRNDAYFVDYNFVGLLVQQNYLKVMQPQFNDAKRQNDDDKMLGVLDRMHDAALSMSDFAFAEAGLRGDQNWSLLPVTAMLTVKTGFHAGGDNGGFLPGFPEFTSWLGRNSSTNKKLRLLSELGHHMNYRVSCGTKEMRMTYLPVLRDRFLTHLKDESEENGPERAIELMDDYGLDRDDIFEKFDEFQMDSKADSFQKIDSKKKAAFTRAYNQGSHKSQALVAEQGASKKPKRQASTIAETADPDAIDDDKVEEDDEKDDEDDEDPEKILASFKKKGGKKKAPPKGNAKPKSKAKKSNK